MEDAADGAVGIGYRLAQGPPKQGLATQRQAYPEVTGMDFGKEWLYRALDHL